jgi:hypothetical protein
MIESSGRDGMADEGPGWTYAEMVVRVIQFVVGLALGAF